MFDTTTGSLTRSDELGKSPGTEPSSELSWCLRSLHRAADSSKFHEQKEMKCDVRDLSLRLDAIITTLRDLIVEETDAL